MIGGIPLKMCGYKTTAVINMIFVRVLIKSESFCQNRETSDKIILWSKTLLIFHKIEFVWLGDFFLHIWIPVNVLMHIWKYIILWKYAQTWIVHILLFSSCTTMFYLTRLRMLLKWWEWSLFLWWRPRTILTWIMPWSVIQSVSCLSR